jgi:glycolate oxidase FAD binding subunit
VSLLKPENASQLAEAVAWAVSEAAPLEVVGRGSKRAFGRPVQAAHTLALDGLSGITLYEPDELVLRANAGTPLSEIEAALAESGQHLAFEPANLAPLLGSDQAATIGGVIACNLAGPRRIHGGAARDHLLGFKAVSGRGEAFKSGGRVVKNVTGYDLSKLMAGSFGTLAVLSEVTVKVLPRPEKTRTILLLGLPLEKAVETLASALGSPHEISGAAFLPAPLAARAGVDRVAGLGVSVTALRIEGPGPSVGFRAAALKAELGARIGTAELHTENSAKLWRWVADVGPFVADQTTIVWRISVPPSAGPAVVRALGLAEERYFLDWGGGLIWLATPPGPEEDAGAARIRAAIVAAGGHATLMRAPEVLRSVVPVFQPQEAALAALSRRVKESFDPAGLLNPGRLYAGD